MVAEELGEYIMLFGRSVALDAQSELLSISLGVSSIAVEWKVLSVEPVLLEILLDNALVVPDVHSATPEQ